MADQFLPGQGEMFSDAPPKVRRFRVRRIQVVEVNASTVDEAQAKAVRVHPVTWTDVGKWQITEVKS